LTHCRLNGGGGGGGDDDDDDDDDDVPWEKGERISRGLNVSDGTELLIHFSSLNFVRKSLIGDFKDERRKSFFSVAFQRTSAPVVVPTNAIKNRHPSRPH
jgi:hypothetical protein